MQSQKNAITVNKLGMSKIVGCDDGSGVTHAMVKACTTKDLILPTANRGVQAATPTPGKKNGELIT